MVVTDGDEEKKVEEFIGEYRVRGYFAHHDDLRRVFFLRGGLCEEVRVEARIRHRREYLPALIERPAEGHHRYHVGEPHLFADFPHGAAFERERVLEFRIVVARSAAPAEHRVFLLRLIHFAAQQNAILIGF